MFKRMLLAATVLSIPMFITGYDKVPVGEVGIKVSNLGGDKGVNEQVLGTGWYWVGFTNSLYCFPTFMQNYVWSASRHEGSDHDESFSFQTADGLSVNADVGIAFQVEPSKIPVLFQTYRKGLNEIRDIYLRNLVRDSIVEAAGSRPIESVYGAGKNELLREALKDVRSKVEPLGIKIVQLSWVGELRLPSTVTASINAKIQATQNAQMIENQVAAAKAEAAKTVARAQGDADSRMLQAKAEADANKIIAQSLTKELVSYQAIMKWDGKLPTYSGGGVVPFLNIETK